MSPNPFLATITDVIKSGIEVPAARKVKPITCEEQSIVQYHSDNMKGPALTWSAVETNWEISSRCLAIRYTTGFKPFYFYCKSIPDICHRHHRQCLCKKKLPGVIFTDLTRKIGVFYRFNTKNWRFFTDLTRKIGAFRCKFYSPKSLHV